MPEDILERDLDGSLEGSPGNVTPMLFAGHKTKNLREMTKGGTDKASSDAPRRHTHFHGQHRVSVCACTSTRSGGVNG